MKIIKQVIIRLIVLGVLLVCFNYIYQRFFYESDLQQYSGYINMVRKVVDEKCEIAYIGESSNKAYRYDDKDKRAISELINDYFPDKRVGMISDGALHAGIYYELLRNIPDNSSVKTIIVTLNLRSFGASWIHGFLKNPLEKSIVLLKDNPPLINRFLLSFRGYDIKSQREREKLMKHAWKHELLRFPYSFKYKNLYTWEGEVWSGGVKNADGSINHPLSELGASYIKNYAFQIDTLTNPRIKDFDNIVLLAKKKGWHLIFNLLAENIENAKQLVGEDLIFLMKQNRDLLVNRYNRNGVMVADNLEYVPSELFIDKEFPTEHYAETGRKTVAKNVAEKLKVIYPDDYK